MDRGGAKHVGGLCRRLDLASAGLALFYLCLLVPAWRSHWLGGVSLVYLLPVLLALLPISWELPPPFHVHRGRRLPLLARCLLLLSPFPAFWIDFPSDLYLALASLAAGYALVWLLMDLSLSCLIVLKGCRSASPNEVRLARLCYAVVVYGLGTALGTTFLLLGGGWFMRLGLDDFGLAGSSLLSALALLFFLPVPLVALVVQATLRRLEREFTDRPAMESQA